MTASPQLRPPARVTTADIPELGDHVLLAIDTAIGTSIALGADGRVTEVSSDDPRGHTELIGTLLAEVFERAGISPERVTGVVAGIGPGPFTGLRVGIAAAHGFAQSRGVPLMPLQGHEAAALDVLAGAGSPVRVVQDAKRRELFVTEFSGLDWAGVPVRSSDPHLVARSDYLPVAGEVWPERIPAAALVRIAARRLAVGGAFEPDQALYIRQPDVLVSAGPKKVTPGV